MISKNFHNIYKTIQREINLWQQYITKWVIMVIDMTLDPEAKKITYKWSFSSKWSINIKKKNNGTMILKKIFQHDFLRPFPKYLSFNWA